jgi:hypothetical protein
MVETDVPKEPLFIEDRDGVSSSGRTQPDLEALDRRTLPAEPLLHVAERIAVREQRPLERRNKLEIKRGNPFAVAIGGEDSLSADPESGSQGSEDDESCGRTPIRET